MEKPPKQTATSNDKQGNASISKRLQTASSQQCAGTGERAAVEISHQPPRKKKNEALVLKHYRLRAIDVRQTEAVIAQRGSDPGDVVRKQYERGVNVDTALGAPGEDGLYGLYHGPRLAELLRPDIDGLISFALNHGVVPTMLQEYRRVIQDLRTQIVASPLVPVATSFPDCQVGQQPEELNLAPATQVADEADGVLDMFFGNSQRKPTHDILDSCCY